MLCACLEHVFMLCAYIRMYVQGHKEDQERALDQRITRIKERNKVLERREKEIEKDKRLYS